MGEVALQRCPYCGKLVKLKGHRCPNCNAGYNIAYNGATNYLPMTIEEYWSAARFVLRSKK